MRLRFVRITNPIDPSRDKIVREEEHEYVDLADAIEEQFDHEGGDREHADAFELWSAGTIVTLNGHRWSRSMWTEVTPVDGDCIVIFPVVKGGGILRTLATIAVVAGAAAATYFSAGASLAFLGAATSSITSAGAALIGSAVSIGGNLLVSAIFGSAAPSSKTPSASYDPDGPKTLARSGTVIPKGYGRFRPGGNIIAQFTDLEGTDQYINALWCGGFGPARNIDLSKVQLNGKDLSTYQNVQVFVRYGTNDQTPIANFSRVVNGYPQQVQCLAGQPIVIEGTGDNVVGLQVDVQFPEGIFWMDSGNLNSEVITYLVEFGPTDAATASASGIALGTYEPVLQPLTTQDLITYDSNGNPITVYSWYVRPTDRFTDGAIAYAADDGPHSPGDFWQQNIPTERFGANGNHTVVDTLCTGEWQPIPSGVNPLLVIEWTDGYVDFVSNSNSPLYNRTSIYGLPAGRWNVRLTKYGSAHLHDDVQPGDNSSPLVGQQMWIHSVNEIQLADLAYPNMILLGIRALATNQLSGSNLQITAEIDFGLRSRDEGLLPAELMAYEEDNPACVAADAMVDTLYGGGEGVGIKAANLERYIPEWVAWAELNDELVDDGAGNSIRRHVFNGVSDKEGNLWDALRTVGGMSRAQVLPQGKDYGVFVDQAVDAPVQMFTVGNILKDSFQETWLELDARANQVEIQFADRDRYYKTDNPLIYMDAAFQNAGVTPKNTRIDGTGISIRAQAWHLARFRERCNQFLLRTGVIKTDIAGIACRAGNVVLLQHDVPQWGTGGRTLPGSTVTKLLLDRSDAPFVAGTSYSVMVMHPQLQHYAGVVSAVATSITPAGFTVTVAGWTDAERITRAVFAGSGTSSTDCAVLSSEAGSIVVSPPPSFEPQVGMSCVLFDTDVIETVPVTAVDAAGNLTLGTPLSQAPQAYSTYIYGVTGAAKWVRVTSMKKAGEQRATLEWIDYDARVYEDATPVLGGVVTPSAAGAAVGSLLGSEIFDITGGNYVGSAKLTWKLGQSTYGVGIYGRTTGGSANTTLLPLPLLAHLTGYPTQWQMKLPVGETWRFTVVGFDVNNNYSAFASAPSVTVTGVGIAMNLLLGSSFNSGFAYWNVQQRLQTPGSGIANDTFAPDLGDDGEAIYTVHGAALTTPVQILSQVIKPAAWAVGELLMLSGYMADTAASGNTNTGTVTMEVLFQNAAGTVIGSQSVAAALDGTGTLRRYTAAAVAIPALTTLVAVAVTIGGTGLSVAIGSTINLNHFLLEVAGTGQTVASAWADIDANGKIEDIFTLGSSSGLRPQGSVLPTFTGTLGYTADTDSITVYWENLVILWPDGGITEVQDASILITGLTASEAAVASLYFDVINGGIHIAPPSAPLAGATPPLLSAAFDILADAICKQDGHVPLTPGGLAMATQATGGGGGGGGVPPGPDPIHCTVRGTRLVTPQPSGLANVSNEVLYEMFASGTPTFLIGRKGPERIVKAWWAPVPRFYRINVDGFAEFGASETMTLQPYGQAHRWCSKIVTGTSVAVADGYRCASIERVDEPVEVLHIELAGPSHEYLVEGGVWTHNEVKTSPVLDAS